MKTNWFKRVSKSRGRLESNSKSRDGSKTPRADEATPDSPKNYLAYLQRQTGSRAIPVKTEPEIQNSK